MFCVRELSPTATSERRSPEGDGAAERNVKLLATSPLVHALATKPTMPHKTEQTRCLMNTNNTCSLSVRAFFTLYTHFFSFVCAKY